MRWFASGARSCIANVIVWPGKQAAPRLAKVAPGPSQSIAPKAGSVHRKAALSGIEEPTAWETTVVPDVRDPVAEPPVAPDAEDPAATQSPIAPDAAAREPEEPEAASGVPIETGRASCTRFPGLRRAERPSTTALTAAHPSFPLGTKVKIDNLANGRSVVVRINDRGPSPKPHHRRVEGRGR